MVVLMLGVILDIAMVNSAARPRVPANRATDLSPASSEDHPTTDHITSSQSNSKYDNYDNDKFDKYMEKLEHNRLNRYRYPAETIRRGSETTTSPFVQQQLQQWLSRIATKPNGHQVRPISSKYPNWKKVSGSNMAAESSVHSHDYDTYSGVAAHWPSTHGTGHHGAHSVHSGYHELPVYSGHKGGHETYHIHHTPHVQYIPIPVHGHQEKGLSHLWPLLLLGAIFLPLLLGALLIPLGLAFLTNLIRLIQLTQGGGLPVGIVQPINGTGRRRRSYTSSNDTNPYLYQKLIEISLDLEKGIKKWLTDDAD